MKVVEIHDIISAGSFKQSLAWRQACKEVERAVEATDWPHGTGRFVIRPVSGRRRGEGNGVVPIKLPCLRYLREMGWQTERLPALEPGVLTTGDLDAIKDTKYGCLAFEWETGNISSSHRAINKLSLALLVDAIVGGFLVVPSDRLKRFLTDRIGNIGELRPYFNLWGSIPIAKGVLRIIVVEHDAESSDVPLIPKGTDGRAIE